MKLQDTLDQIQEELDKRELSLNQREQSISGREAQVDASTSLIESRERELSILSDELARKESVVLTAEAQDSRIKTLQQLEASAALNRIEADKRERALAEMLATVKDREEKVAVRESNVSQKEENYKETLQKEFFEGIRKNLPQ